MKFSIVNIAENSQEYEVKRERKKERRIGKRMKYCLNRREKNILTKNTSAATFPASSVL
jgi:secreted PhoX family phosphatase